MNSHRKGMGLVVYMLSPRLVASNHHPYGHIATEIFYTHIMLNMSELLTENSIRVSDIGFIAHQHKQAISRQKRYKRIRSRRIKS